MTDLCPGYTRVKVGERRVEGRGKELCPDYSRPMPGLSRVGKGQWNVRGDRLALSLSLCLSEPQDVGHKDVATGCGVFNLCSLKQSSRFRFSLDPAAA